jgi:hypothetical protein
MSFKGYQYKVYILRKHRKHNKIQKRKKVSAEFEA